MKDVIDNIKCFYRDIYFNPLESLQRIQGRNRSTSIQSIWHKALLTGFYKKIPIQNISIDSYLCRDDVKIHP